MNYEKSKAELTKIFGAIKKLEGERERIVGRIEQERQKVGESVADALLAGDGAEPAKTKTKASNKLDQLESELAELDGTMSALTARWGKALRDERQAARTIHTERAQVASNEVEALQAETARLAEEITQLNGQAYTLAGQADEALGLADEAGEFLSRRVGIFRGGPDELKARLANDETFILDRQQACGLLTTWEKGAMVTLRSGIRDKSYATQVVLFYDRMGGEILDSRIIESKNDAGKLLYGLREVRVSEIDAIKDRLEKSLA